MRWRRLILTSICRELLQDPAARTAGDLQAHGLLRRFDRGGGLRPDPPIGLAIVKALGGKRLLQALALRPAQARIVGRPWRLERRLALQPLGEMAEIASA